MKAILLGIRPEWLTKILNGEKTIEIRKLAPKCELPVEVYIYCTKSKNEKDIFHRFPRSRYDETLVYQSGGYIATECQRLDGKIVAKFTLKKVDKFEIGFNFLDDLAGNGKDILKPEYCKNACVSAEEVERYLRGDEYGKYGYSVGYMWHISDLQIFDKPRELGEFKKCGGNELECGFCEYRNIGCVGHRKISRPPQSYMFIEV